MWRADCQPKVPCHGFSYEAHTDMILRLTEECKCSLTEEDADAKP
jgi:hypothetical protein